MIEYDFSMIKPAVIRMLKVNMGLKDGESVLFMADAPNLADWYGGESLINDFAMRSMMLRAAYGIAREELKSNTVDLLFYPSCGCHGTEPPASVAEKMLAYDVLIIINTWSLSHTRARENACAKGARIASCANLDLDMLYPNGVVDTDYFHIAEKSKHIAALLSPARAVRLVTPEGTELTFSIEGRQGAWDDGFYTEPGLWGNLPGGEAYVAPVEGTGNGTVVLPAGWAFGLKEDMTCVIKKGLLTEVTGGGTNGDFYREFLLGPESPVHRRNLAELGIGTNYRASKPDSVLEAEKIDGTVHIAFGDSSHLGGIVESDYHDDLILPHPDLYLDGELVMKDGKLLK